MSHHNHLSRRHFIKTGLCAGSTLLLGNNISQASPAPLPMPRPEKLPRWRGFNLMEKFMAHSNGRFLEEDFKNIHDLGFNFVRVPMDYRCWIIDGDRRKIDTRVIDQIAEAVQFGEKYSVHVCLNFHRAPGWTVAQPPEKPSVWTDRETLDICTQHWSTFARRFKQYGPEQLSFNLFNEPAEVEDDDFFRVHQTLVEAIRAERSDRLIICDGRGYGRRPDVKLAKLKVAQSTRGYTPMNISHYKAEWIDANYSKPSWPLVLANGYLYNSGKPGLSDAAKRPMEINGPFNESARLRLRVGKVSTHSILVVEVDGKEVFRKEFRPQEGKGEWQKAVYNPRWKAWQNIYHLDLSLDIPSGTKQIILKNIAGDWMSLDEIGIKTNSMEETVLPMTYEWDGDTPRIQYQYKDGHHSLVSLDIYGRNKLWKETIEPWLNAEKHGIGVMVGEFGAYNKTPHEVVIAWMNDMLANWQKAGWGWALWNFRGAIGVLDSGRTDVDYETWRGHKVDRKMLDLLLKY